MQRYSSKAASIAEAAAVSAGRWCRMVLWRGGLSGCRVWGIMVNSSLTRTGFRRSRWRVNVTGSHLSRTTPRNQFSSPLPTGWKLCSPRDRNSVW